MTVVVSTAYWPNLHYFYYLLSAQELIIDQYEHYLKQSYRNRTQIISANGLLDLVIPVKNSGNKTLVKEVEMDYKEKWQLKHWRAITSAYKNSPYFDFFEEEFAAFYQEQEQYLLSYNVKQLNLIFKILRKKNTFRLSEQFIEESEAFIDKRFSIHPKLSFENDAAVATVLKRPYYQTFGTKHGFVPNASILDLIFNQGKGVEPYLLNV